MSQRRIAIPPTLRFQVLHKNGFRCVYCGAMPDKGELHVDHVIPVSAGGTNDIGNLIAACSECNIGKGARALVAIEESDVGVYVKPPRPARGVIEWETGPLREEVVAEWFRLLAEKWEQVHLRPGSISVEGVAGYRRDFFPTFVCVGRENSDIAPAPCEARVLVVPMRPINGWTNAERKAITSAVISGYDVPTIILMGAPRLFLGILVKERYKGCPLGHMVDQFLEPFDDWSCGWSPDEVDSFVDPRANAFWAGTEVLLQPRAGLRDGSIVGHLCSFTGEAL